MASSFSIRFSSSNWFWFLLAGICSFGCGGKLNETGTGLSYQTEFTDMEVLNAVYSDYKYPAGFYSENLDSGRIFYLNSKTIKPKGNNPQENQESIELCSDDRNEAYAWTELHRENDKYLGKIVSEQETERYFQFRFLRYLPVGLFSMIRIHKCSYVTWKVNRRALTAYLVEPIQTDTLIGALNISPITPADVKLLVEYLWLINHHNNVGEVVLTSFGDSHGDRYIHTIYETILARLDWGISDHIALVKSEYTVNKKTGNIRLTKTHIRNIVGRSAPGPFD